MEDLYLADQDPYDETVDIYEAVKDKVKEFEKNIRIPQSDSNEEVLTAKDFKAIFPMFDFDKFLENIVPVTLTFDNGTIAFHCAETFGSTLSHHSYDVLNEELHFTKWESAIGKLSFEITSELPHRLRNRAGKSGKSLQDSRSDRRTPSSQYGWVIPS